MDNNKTKEMAETVLSLWAKFVAIESYKNFGDHYL